MKDKRMIIGYTAGVFDMFHIGHLNVIRRAKEQCDYLIVAVSTDDLARREKGKTPVIPYAERSAIVEAIKYVDKVVPKNKGKMAACKYHFHNFFCGFRLENTSRWNAYEAQFASVEVDIIYLQYIDGIPFTQ